MIVNHNMGSLNTLNSLNANNTTMMKSLAKLSSGLRINSAADDAAGLAISEKMRGQISGLDQASSNAENGISLLQTAEGALDETTSILQRMRELAVEASSDTLTDDDRTDIQSEFDQLIDEVDRIASTTQFNTKNLLDGSMAACTAALSNISANSALANGSTSATISLTATIGSCTITSSSLATCLGLTCGSTYSIAGASVSITSTTTVADLVDAINSGSTSVTAAVDSKGLEITSNTTGTASTLCALGATFTTAVACSTYCAVAGTAGSSTLCTGLCSTTLVSLGDTGNNSLGIQAGDTISFSFVKNGEMTTCTLAVTSCTTLDDLNTKLQCSGAGSLSIATDGTISIKATTAGSEGAVYGLTMTVTDVTGDEVSTASSALSDWTQTQAATDKRSNGTSSILIGANTGQTFDISINAMDATSLGVRGLQVSTFDEADVAVSVIDTATRTVSAERGKMGAEQNRLEHTINNLTTSSENITSAESRIRDVDMAAEMANYTKLSVINQAATAMLAQANQLPQQVLSLLQ